MSLEEELCWSRETHRYRIPRRDWLASAAAMTLNLARSDLEGGTKLYAAPIPTAGTPKDTGRERWTDGFSAVLHASDGHKAISPAFPIRHGSARRGPPTQKEWTSLSTVMHDAPVLVLVSTQFYRCGRYLVDFKAQVQREARHGRTSGSGGRRRTIASQRRGDGDHTHEEEDMARRRPSFPPRGAAPFCSSAVPSTSPSLALQAAVAHVFYHNPYTTPIWSPPFVSADLSSRMAMHSDTMDNRATEMGENDPHGPNGDVDGSASLARQKEREVNTNAAIFRAPVSEVLPLRNPHHRYGEDDGHFSSSPSPSRNMEGESATRSSHPSTESRVSEHLRALQHRIIPQKKKRPLVSSFAPK